MSSRPASSRRVPALALAVAGSLALAAITPGAQARPEAARVDQAVTKGVAWLKGRQQPNGQWKDKWEHAYPTGETAIALLALLKSDVPADDPAIKKGFDWLLEQPFKKTYDVSIGILAVEALFSPKPKAPDAKNPYRTIVKKGFQKGANDRIKDWLQRAASFLAANQKADGLWGYPVGGDPDLSNMQFALLALKGARRLGVKLDPVIWARSLEYLLANQEKSGKKVAGFEIPAADGPIDDVEDRKAQSRARAADTSPKTGSGFETRGWGYKANQGARGSMTAAGVAMCVIAKSELEGSPGFEKKLEPAVNKAIRDGCAWLADRFKAKEHPGAELDWLFYYLYTLERAGTLAGFDQLGSHDWYAEGAEAILGLQDADGHFERKTPGEIDGNVAGTCLALLFLKRATVPVIERIATGMGGGEAAPAPGAGGPAAPGKSDPKKPGIQVEKLADGNFAVTFRIKPAGSPTKVSVAGSFNGWDKAATPLASGPDGVFEATVRMPAGKITYKFVLNDTDWQLDAANPTSEDDGHGNKNSAFTVG